MCWCFGWCFGDSIEDYPRETGCLERGQTLKKTFSGKTINSNIQKSFDPKEVEKCVLLKTPGLLGGPVFQRPLSHFSQITDTLFLTSFGGLTEHNISQNGIHCIISATYETPVIAVNGIEFIRIPVEDNVNENIYKYFDEISEKVNQLIASKKKTVIHCWAGKCRSTTILIACLMKCQNMPLTEAYKFVWSKRPFIRINKGFLKQLYVYEKDVFDKNFEEFNKIKSLNNFETPPKEVLLKFSEPKPIGTKNKPI
ncbi:unnamed protein product [Medioppia subpectinata]|uniref:Dual specificity protein phosphatase n=1 Tax=Medioppia subpectinata TaxID=1979941 RepID=A0A7R9KBS6_9ACAR|nr:unnamed protein product [Medioppia subpectinata]CAG2100287.1 unnamed protein product [Medioppia subpectinata]